MGSLPASLQIHQKLIKVTEQLLQSNLWTTAEDSSPPGGQTRLPGMRSERGWRHKKEKDRERLGGNLCPERGTVGGGGGDLGPGKLAGRRAHRELQSLGAGWGQEPEGRKQRKLHLSAG